MQDKQSPIILRVAVPVPLRPCFDYLLPEGVAPGNTLAGMRVLVPFGRSNKIGIIDEVCSSANVEPARLKAAIRIIDTEALLDQELLRLCRWVSQYYHHPLGEVYATAMPAALRRERPATLERPVLWQLSMSGRQVTSLPARAHRQQALMTHLQQADPGLSEEQLDGLLDSWRPTMRTLQSKGWVECCEQQVPAVKPLTVATEPDYAPNPAQQQAITAIQTGLGQFAAYLLYGVTGSGKTEVYLQAIARVLESGQQALILVPEIGLTPQLVQRFRERFDVPQAVFHSGLGERERAHNWLQAKAGTARIIIGTRSAVFTPLASAGLIIVDEEHDLSFKQQDGLRYSARDLAIVRARQLSVPVVLGSATPSLESLFNADQQRYQLLELPERAAATSHPQMKLIDLRHQPVDDGLSEVLLRKIAQHVEQGGQALLFLNRRGYAPALLCHDCGWVSQCQRCDASMTYHQASQRMRCHHCGHERPPERACPTCGSVDLRAIGQGTERAEEVLRRHFTQARIMRIDRDTTRRKGAMEQKLADAESGHAQILLGTQLLAKGHHFPNLSLVAILDSDQGLFSVDFRGAERMAQLIMQVAGRAGRAERPGEVLIQTHHPEHALLQLALGQDYHALSRHLLDERQQAQWPPFSYLALLRAEATQQSMPMQFLRDAANCAKDDETVLLLGPVVAPMEKRAGRFRAQLLIQSTERAALHTMLDTWLPQLEQLKLARQVRWSLDVDPQDMY